MTPTDLETLPCPEKIQRYSLITKTDHYWGGEFTVMEKDGEGNFVKYEALTALLAEYERMREGLDNVVQQLSELAQPVTPAMNGSYAKGEQVGYENAVRIISALCAPRASDKVTDAEIEEALK